MIKLLKFLGFCVLGSLLAFLLACTGISLLYIIFFSPWGLVIGAISILLWLTVGRE